MFQFDSNQPSSSRSTDDTDDEIVISRTTGFSERLSQAVFTMSKDNDFTDFLLKTGDKVLACHRIIIAANSPVLKAMLKSKMKEVTQKQIQLDIIKATQGAALKFF